MLSRVGVAGRTLAVRGAQPIAMRRLATKAAASSLNCFSRPHVVSSRASSLAVPARASLSAGARGLASSANSGIISLKELKSRMKDKSVVVIDVREPDEIAATGAIEHAGMTAANIPLGLICGEANVLSMSPEDVEHDFGVKLPAKDDDSKAIVFSCRSGMRAGNAAMMAESLGYKNVLNYKGSANEWFSQ